MKNLEGRSRRKRVVCGRNRRQRGLPAQSGKINQLGDAGAMVAMPVNASFLAAVLLVLGMVEHVHGDIDVGENLFRAGKSRMRLFAGAFQHVEGRGQNGSNEHQRRQYPADLS